MPPSTATTLPVMKLASSEARKRADHVAADALLDVVQRHPFGEHHTGTFGRRVNSEKGLADQTIDAGDVHDRAAAHGKHVRDDRATAVQSTLHIHIERLVDDVVGDFVRQPRQIDSGFVTRASTPSQREATASVFAWASTLEETSTPRHAATSSAAANSTAVSFAVFSERSAHRTFPPSRRRPCTRHGPSGRRRGWSWSELPCHLRRHPRRRRGTARPLESRQRHQAAAVRGHPGLTRWARGPTP